MHCLGRHRQAIYPTLNLFMRHVPLGRMIAQTTLATIVFGGVGFAMHLNPFIAAPAGFLAAAARLAIVTPRRRLSPDSARSSLLGR